MAARTTSTRTLRILRTVLLVTLIGFLALVFALYRFGRAGLPDSEPTTDERQSDLTTESAVMAAEGFDYSITQGSTTLARIRAHRVVSQQENEVTLEQIDPIEVYRTDGSVYSVSSDAGTYNFDTQATTLSGNVVLRGPRGLELHTESLTMGRANQAVVSRSRVTFSMAGEFSGRAQRLTADLDRDLFVLAGDVRALTINPLREPVGLIANRLSLDRTEGLIRAEGNARFFQGESYLESDRIVFHLTEDERNIRFISGRWGIRARRVQRFSAPGLVRTTTVEADQFSVQINPDTGEPTEAQLLATREATTRLETTDETGLVRELRAPVINARFVAGELRHAETSGNVQIRESWTFARRRALRWICGERALVDLGPDGEIRAAVFEENVELRQGRSIARADRAELTDGDPQKLDLTGDPARLTNPQGELTAPLITQLGEDGEIRATGGVRGQFVPAGGSEAISIGGGKGPIRVESAEASWDHETPSFKFEQQVRLWQGENLLIAEEVETLTEQDVVIARGGVRTILVPEPEEEATEEPGEQTEGTDESEASSAEERASDPAAGGPAEITSEWMEYATETRLIIYHENVLIRQAGRKMSCDRAEATMAESGGLSSMHCLGSASVEDSVAGRTVVGENAFYQVGMGEITFEGSPVVLTGEQGERIEGATLVYDLSSGAARVERAVGAPPPSPTVDDDDGEDDASDPDETEDDGGG